MPYTPNTTWVDGSGGGTPISAARLNNIEAGVTITYDTYTPAWTASGSAPSIGNGSVYGRYMQRGKFVHCFGWIQFGSSSTFGTGTYAISLPVNIHASHTRVAGLGDLYDSSTTARAMANVERSTASTMIFTYPGAYLGASAIAAQTAPWTWAQSDFIAWNLTYEAA